MPEPNMKTEYKDEYSSPIDGSDEFSLLLVGLANDGEMDTIYPWAGLNGVGLCETLYGVDGRLPRACREAISGNLNDPERDELITVNTMRIGASGAKASATLKEKDSTAVTGLTVEYDYCGTDGNEWYIMTEKDLVENEMTVTIKRTSTGTSSQFTASLAATNTNTLLANAINASSLQLTATANTEKELLEIAWTLFTGGLSGSITNAEISRVLTLLEGTEHMAVLILGAKGSGEDASSALRALLGTHAASSLADHDQERFFFLEMEDFESANTPKSAAWLVDINTWTTSIQTALASEDDKNLIAFAGQKDFNDGDTTEYEANVAAYAAGIWLGHAINRSLINIKTDADRTDLQPEIPKSFRNTLAAARVNYIHWKKGRNVIVNVSKTLVVDGSDFEDCEILRTAYVSGGEARTAGLPQWGRWDDADGNGKVGLATAMKVPLDLRKGKAFSDYTINVNVDAEGYTYADLRFLYTVTMKNVTHRVYRKSA